LNSPNDKSEPRGGSGSIKTAIGNELAGTRSIRRTCAILRLLGQSAQADIGLHEIAAASRMPKSSAHRYLLVLEREGFVERDPSSQRYRLGLAFVTLHGRQADWLVERAKPLLEKIRDKWNESANLGMLLGDAIVYLEIIESPEAIRLAARRGDRDSIHSTALGKAIAATLPDAQVLALLKSTGMPRRTKRTITDPNKFLAELVGVRSSGYAVDDRENEEEGRCVAVFVAGLGVPVAISVSGLASRFPIDRVTEVARSLTKAAAQLSGTRMHAITEPPVRTPRIRANSS
jgi:IclR family acetate operon transcriptional repressor